MPSVEPVSAKRIGCVTGVSGALTAFGTVAVSPGLQSSATGSGGAAADADGEQQAFFGGSAGAFVIELVSGSLTALSYRPIKPLPPFTRSRTDMKTRLPLIVFAVALGFGAAWLMQPAAVVAERDAEGSGAAPTDSDRPDFARPDSDAMNAEAPEAFDARFETSAGDFVIRVHREWAPNGADRFYNLVRSGYYDGQKFFRVVEGFVVQWGIHGDPDVSKLWRDARIADDPIREDVSNTAGRVVFANAGPDTRTTQLFINLEDNDFLDDPVRMRGSVFAPLGEVIEGMDAVKAIYDGYIEPRQRSRIRLPPERHQAPDQAFVQEQGNAYLEKYFPKLDAIKSASIVRPEDANIAATQPSD